MNDSGNGWLRVHLEGISNQIKDLDEKFDTFVITTCPSKHNVTSQRVAEIETEMSNRKYLSRWLVGAVAFISGLVGAFGDKIWKLLTSQ